MRTFGQIYYSSNGSRGGMSTGSTHGLSTPETKLQNDGVHLERDSWNRNVPLVATNQQQCVALHAPHTKNSWADAVEKKGKWEWQKSNWRLRCQSQYQLMRKKKESPKFSGNNQAFRYAWKEKQAEWFRTKAEVFLGCPESEKREEAQLSRAWHPFCYFRGSKRWKWLQ